MKTYDPIKAAAAQAAHCREIEAPLFAPDDGYCNRCFQNIYRAPDPEHGIRAGISVEEAGTRLITGCPFCHYSYVE